MTTSEINPAGTSSAKGLGARRTLVSAAISLLLAGGMGVSDVAMATTVSSDDGGSLGNTLRARIQGWRAERLTGIRDELIGMHETLRDEIREWGDMIRDDAEDMRDRAHGNRLPDRDAIVNDLRGRLDHLERARFDRGFEGPVVPVPAAIWLFGSGLLGLIGVTLRRKRAA